MGQCLFLTPKIDHRKSLEAATYDSVDSFEPPSGFAKVLDAYDADTCRVALPMNDGTLTKFTVRLLGIDAPERKPAKKSHLHDLEKAAAMRCRARFLTMVTDPGTFDLSFTGSNARDECGSSHQLVRLDGKMFDKYGRILANIYVGGVCVNQALAKEGWVRAYDGTTREPWTRKELEAILALPTC
jgi:endonuclease YncB( thermonuclease family)